jgi:hypothetical protein
MVPRFGMVPRFATGPSLGMSPSLHPFALSLSKGSSAEIWLDKPVLSGAEGLTTNGYRWFDKLTTNGIGLPFYGKEMRGSLPKRFI